ncbi:MAG: hypothetical protein JO250_22400 [Armatimonadetes bacterium]|nr:hypothetical protein [Armatimonadota bacterium]
MTKDDAEALLSRYTTQVTTLKREPGTWDILQVDILQDGRKIGGYTRNYPSLFNTFVPFVQEGQVYALYSRNYTAARLMRLPECEDMGGEEPSPGGFCPTDFYVPYLPEKDLVGKWGFISGCVWGDDSSWKIQYLDLIDAAQGILRREERFGYLEMASHLSLKECVSLSFYYPGDDYEEIEFTIRRVYSMAQGKFAQGFDGYD